MVHFHDGIRGPLSDADLHIDPAGAAGLRAGLRTRCARPYAPGGWRPAPGCRRPARSPPTWGSPATPWPTPTPNWSPRAGSPPGRARAPGSPQRAERHARPAARAPGRSRPARAPARLQPDARLARPVAFPRADWLKAARRALTAAPTRPSATATRAGASSCAPHWPAIWRGPAGCTRTPERIVDLLRLRPRAGAAGAGAAAAAGAGGGRRVVRTGRRTGTCSRRRPAHRPAAARRTRRPDRGADRDAPGVRRGAADPRAPVPHGRAAAPRPAGRSRRLGAARAGGLILEDDYDGEFRYDRQPVGALQGLDPEHVVYMGTASKSLAPGLRLAWMVLPRPAAWTRWPRRRATVDWQSGALDQLTLAEFIDSGRLRPPCALDAAALPAPPRPAGRRARRTGPRRAGQRHRRRTARRTRTAARHRARRPAGGGLAAARRARADRYRLPAPTRGPTRSSWATGHRQPAPGPEPSTRCATPWPPGGREWQSRL